MAPHIMNLALHSPPATGLWAKIASLPRSCTVTQASSQVKCLQAPGNPVAVKLLVWKGPVYSLRQILLQKFLDFSSWLMKPSESQHSE